MAKYNAPANKNKQKTLAALLAIGTDVKLAAKTVGVSTTYVNQLLRGDLFQYEIDEQRRILIGERVAEYSKLVSEQLEPNLRALIEIRDDETTPPAARLRAIELINETVVPKAVRKTAATEMRVNVKLTPEQKQAIDVVATEDK